MKNLLKKHILFVLIALYAPTIFAMFTTKRETPKPFPAKTQKMLDKIVQKFELGNPGDYNGYIDPNIPFHAIIIREKKQILFHPCSLDFPKKEQQFLLGHELGYLIHPHNTLSVVRWNTAKNVSLGIVNMIAGGYIGTKIGEKYDTPSFSMAIGTTIGLVITLYLRKDSCTKDLTSHCEEIEHTADKIAVEKLNCHQDAINYFRRGQKEEKEALLKESFRTHPFPEDRIARIEELLKRKEARSHSA